MFIAIALTFVVTALAMSLGFMLYVTYTNRKTYEKVKKEMKDLKKELSERNAKEQREVEQRAYFQGLHDGRETDTIYRSLLNKHAKGERFTALVSSNERWGSVL